MLAFLHTSARSSYVASQTLCKSFGASITRHKVSQFLNRGDRQASTVAHGTSHVSATVTPRWSQRLLRLRASPSSRRCYARVIDKPAPQPSGNGEFPFPTHVNPTPHEIFHLPRAATQSQIKARYYQLVRYHHPDSHHCQCLPGDQSHERFQKIVAAYDYLRGATSSPHPDAKRYGFDAGQSNFDPYLHELARRRRAQQAANNDRHWSEGFGAPKASRADDFDQNGSRERTILAFGVLAVILGLYPSFVLFPFHLEKTHKAAVMNLAQARSDAREMGEQRRAEIRKRVESMQRDGTPEDEGFGGGSAGDGSESSMDKA